MPFFYINGEQVSERIFDRDAEDNFNASIRFETIEDEAGNCYMTYDEED